MDYVIFVNGTLLFGTFIVAVWSVAHGINLERRLRIQHTDAMFKADEAYQQGKADVELLVENVGDAFKQTKDELKAEVADATLRATLARTIAEQALDTAHEAKLTAEVEAKKKVQIVYDHLGAEARRKNLESQAQGLSPDDFDMDFS